MQVAPAPAIELPRYYVPQGVEAPKHILFPGPMELYAGHGPDVADGGCGGGRLYGAQEFVDGEPGWSKTEAGWYLCMSDGCCPQHLIRLDTHPRIVRWKHVDGVVKGHAWRVPVLLQPDRVPEIPGREPDTYVSALDSVWTKEGWKDPDDLATIQRLLLEVALNIGKAEDFDTSERELVQVVAAVLGLGHHVSVHELERSGWLSKALLLRVLLTTLDLTPSENGPEQNV